MMPVCGWIKCYGVIASHRREDGRESVRGSWGRGQVRGRRRKVDKQRRKQPLALEAKSGTLLTDHNPELRPLLDGHTDEGEETGSPPPKQWTTGLVRVSFFHLSPLSLPCCDPPPSTTEVSIGTKWLRWVIKHNLKQTTQPTDNQLWATDKLLQNATTVQMRVLSSSVFNFDRLAETNGRHISVRELCQGNL